MNRYFRYFTCFHIASTSCNLALSYFDARISGMKTDLQSIYTAFNFALSFIVNSKQSKDIEQTKGGPTSLMLANMGWNRERLCRLGFEGARTCRIRAKH